MGVKNYRYLNDLFYSRLDLAIRSGPKKMPAKQWIDWIKSQANKGVKLSESQDIGLFEALEESDQSKSMTKHELLDLIALRRPGVKEFSISPQYRRYSHAKEGDEYQEILYELSSAATLHTERLHEIEFELEEMDFGFGIDPARVSKLSLEFEEIKKLAHKAVDFKGAHHSGIIDPETGQELKNILGHIRYTIDKSGLFLIEEIQSDWAQKGRRFGWDEQDRPKAQFVTDTELWSSLLLRRALQIAAENSNVKKVAIISGHGTHNGNTSPDADCDSQGKPVGVTSFYRQLSSRMQKWLKSAKTKIELKEVPSLCGKAPVFEMTDKARDQLRAPQPYYCADDVTDHNLTAALNLTDEEKEKMNTELKARQQELKRAIASAKEMLGDVASIRLSSQIIRAADEKVVAGQMLGNIIEVSVNARNPVDVLNHEAWHYAHENLIGPIDRQVIEQAFSNGTNLNNAVRAVLIRNGYSDSALAQCDDAKEAAAYGFAFWVRGEIGLTRAERFELETPQLKGFSKCVSSIFTKVEKAFLNMHLWVKRISNTHTQTTREEHVKNVFDQFKSKALAQLKGSDDQPSGEQPLHYSRIPFRTEIEAHMVTCGWVKTPEDNWIKPDTGKIVYTKNLPDKTLFYAFCNLEQKDPDSVLADIEGRGFDFYNKGHKKFSMRMA